MDEGEYAPSLQRQVLDDDSAARPRSSKSVLETNDRLVAG